jgi:hypothetical protein
MFSVWYPLQRRYSLTTKAAKAGGTMSLSRHEAQPAIQVSDAVAVALEELEEERTALEQQRSHLSDQRMLLDLERKELELQMHALQLHYALLDQLSARLVQQEAMLASEADQIRLTGKRSSPRRSTR